jgi:transcriptional regulator with XRE-family HTH domain
MTKEQAKRIGQLIATARRNKGWSTRRLGIEAGVSHVWLSKLERGEYVSPSPDRLMRVTDALGVDPERIDRVAKGQMSESLPGMRTYFRAKYELSQEEINEVERTVEDIQRRQRDDER